MSTWDDEAGYDRSDPKHPSWHDRMTDVWDLRNREALLSHDRVAEQGPEEETRFPCDLGCGKDFASSLEMEVHLICDHEGEAA